MESRLTLKKNLQAGKNQCKPQRTCTAKGLLGKSSPAADNQGNVSLLWSTHNPWNEVLIPEVLHKQKSCRERERLGRGRGAVTFASELVRKQQRASALAWFFFFLIFFFPSEWIWLLETQKHWLSDTSQILRALLFWCLIPDEAKSHSDFRYDNWIWVLIALDSISGWHPRKIEGGGWGDE